MIHKLIPLLLLTLSTFTAQAYEPDWAIPNVDKIEKTANDSIKENANDSIEGYATGYLGNTRFQKRKESYRDYMFDKKFYAARDFSQSLAAAAKSKEKWGYIDVSGNWVIQPKLYDCGDFHEGLAFAKPSKKEGYGFIDRSGQWVIKPKFLCAKDFHNGVALAQSEAGLWGIIDKNGNWVISPQYASISPFDGDYFKVKTSQNKIGVIDRDGKWIISPDFSEIESFHEGFAAAKSYDNGEWGFINYIGQWIINPQYAKVRKFSHGAALVSNDYSSDNYRNFITCDPKSKVREIDSYPFYGSKTFDFSEGILFVNKYETRIAFNRNNIAYKAEAKGYGMYDIHGKCLLSGTKAYYRKAKSYTEELSASKGGYITSALYDGIKKAERFNGGLAHIEEYSNKGYIKHPYFDTWTFDDYLENTIGTYSNFAKFRGLTENPYTVDEESHNRRIESLLDEWGKKGEYEKTAAWEQRVTPENREKKLAELKLLEEKDIQEEIEQLKIKNQRREYLESRLKKEYESLLSDACKSYGDWMEAKFLCQGFQLLDYQADAEQFTILSDKNGILLLSVPLKDAPGFKEKWNAIQVDKETPMAGNIKRQIRLHIETIGGRPVITGASVAGYPLDIGLK